MYTMYYFMSYCTHRIQTDDFNKLGKICLAQSVRVAPFWRRKLKYQKVYIDLNLQNSYPLDFSLLETFNWGGICTYSTVQMVCIVYVYTFSFSWMICFSSTLRPSVCPGRHGDRWIRWERIISSSWNGAICSWSCNVYQAVFSVFPSSSNHCPCTGKFSA